MSDATFTLDTSGSAEWRPVGGYEGLYEVSNFGEVRSLDRWVSGRPGVARIIQGVTLRAKSLKGTAYRYVNLYRDGKMIAVGVHRLVAKAFAPNPEGKPEVNHLDNDPSNNRADNLAWATGLENAAHKYAQMRGRGHLTAQQVREIRAAWPSLAAGDKAAFAARYGIGAHHLWKSELAAPTATLEQINDALRRRLHRGPTPESAAQTTRVATRPRNPRGDPEGL